MAKDKCKCNFWWSALATILLTFGIYSLVLGFISQTSLRILLDWNAIVFYLVGLVLIGFAKWAKWSGCGSCKIHMK